MQNPNLLSHLLDTGNRTIIEACSDEVWGTGVTLGDKNCLNSTKWTTKGILGKILMRIRDSCTETEMEQNTASSDNSDIEDTG